MSTFDFSDITPEIKDKNNASPSTDLSEKQFKTIDELLGELFKINGISNATKGKAWNLAPLHAKHRVKQRGFTCQTTALGNVHNSLCEEHKLSGIVPNQAGDGKKSSPSVRKSLIKKGANLVGLSDLTTLVRVAGTLNPRIGVEVYSNQEYSSYCKSIKAAIDAGLRPIVHYDVDITTFQPEIHKWRNYHSAVIVGYYYQNDIMYFILDHNKFFNGVRSELLFQSSSQDQNEIEEQFLQWRNKKGQSCWYPEAYSEELKVRQYTNTQKTRKVISKLSTCGTSLIVLKPKPETKIVIHTESELKLPMGKQWRAQFVGNNKDIENKHTIFNISKLERSAILKVASSNLECPNSCVILKDSRVLPDGGTFDKGFLESWMQTSNKHPVNPEKTIEAKQLRNNTLINRIAQTATSIMLDGEEYLFIDLGFLKNPDTNEFYRYPVVGEDGETSEGTTQNILYPNIVLKELIAAVLQQIAVQEKQQNETLNRSDQSSVVMAEVLQDIADGKFVEACNKSINFLMGSPVEISLEDGFVENCLEALSAHKDLQDTILRAILSHKASFVLHKILCCTAEKQFGEALKHAINFIVPLTAEQMKISDKFIEQCLLSLAKSVDHQNTLKETIRTKNKVLNPNQSLEFKSSASSAEFKSHVVSTSATSSKASKENKDTKDEKGDKEIPKELEPIKNKLEEYSVSQRIEYIEKLLVANQPNWPANEFVLFAEALYQLMRNSNKITYSQWKKQPEYKLDPDAKIEPYQAISEVTEDILLASQGIFNEQIVIARLKKSKFTLFDKTEYGVTLIMFASEYKNQAICEFLLDQHITSQLLLLKNASITASQHTKYSLLF